MKIKSDAKEKVSFKWFTSINEKWQLYTLKPYVKLTFIALLIFFIILSWNNVSGLLSVLLGFYTILYIFNTKRGEISIFIENLLWTSIVALPLTIAGSCNVYEKPIEYKEIPIVKYELIESTEKMVVFPNKPFDNVLVFNLPSSTFFSFRDSIKNGSIPILKIKKQDTYDHIDKVLYHSNTTETSYTLFVQVGNIEYIYGKICNPGTNVSNECVKLFSDVK